MAAKNHSLLLLIGTIILHASFFPASMTANSTTVDDEAGQSAYDVLDTDNLPRGLLPLGVQSYVVHVGGGFDVTLPGECSFSITADGKQYRFRYARSVGGVLINSSLTRVYGIKLQLASTWFNVSVIASTGGDLIKMQLETSTQYFPVGVFIHSPRCD